MTPQEQEDARVAAGLQAMARVIDKGLPYRWGFVLLAFPFGKGGRLNYASNADRPDVVRAMYEFIEATKEQWEANTSQSSERPQKTNNLAGPGNE